MNTQDPEAEEALTLLGRVINPKLHCRFIIVLDLLQHGLKPRGDA